MQNRSPLDSNGFVATHLADTTSSWVDEGGLLRGDALKPRSGQTDLFGRRRSCAGLLDRKKRSQGPVSRQDPLARRSTRDETKQSGSSF